MMKMSSTVKSGHHMDPSLALYLDNTSSRVAGCVGLSVATHTPFVSGAKHVSAGRAVYSFTRRPFNGYLKLDR